MNLKGNNKNQIKQRKKFKKNNKPAKVIGHRREIVKEGGGGRGSFKRSVDASMGAI